MSTELATFAAAPLDRRARIATRSTWPLAVVLALIGGLFLFVGFVGAVVGEAVLGVLLLVVAALSASLPWYFGPVAYIVEEGRFTVRRRKASPRSFTGTLARGRRGRLGRVHATGSGGAYGYLGRYHAEGRTVRAFVTDRNRVVLLDVGTTALAISPDDPEAFLAEVRRAA